MMERRTLLVGTAIGLGLAVSSAAAQTDKATLFSNLKDLEIKSWDNGLRGDFAAMERYFSEDAVVIMGDGIKYTKGQFIESMKTTEISDIKIGEMSFLQISPDVASVIYDVQYSSASKGQAKTTSKAKGVGTYVQRNGTWFQILYQETPSSISRP